MRMCLTKIRFNSKYMYTPAWIFWCRRNPPDYASTTRAVYDTVVYSERSMSLRHCCKSRTDGWDFWCSTAANTVEYISCCFEVLSKTSQITAVSCTGWMQSSPAMRGRSGREEMQWMSTPTRWGTRQSDLVWPIHRQDTLSILPLALAHPLSCFQPQIIWLPVIK